MEPFDHRILGPRLDLFHFQEEGPGMVFWHPKGWVLYRLIEDYMRARMKECGFREIRTPQILAKSLWERSGHWEKFGEHMFVVADGEREHAVKPMSCPGHIQVFNSRLRSYRDLPLRYAEFGACHRNEPSGALQGLMRARSFVQDDAHVLCRLDQVEAEVLRFAELLRRIYADFGFADFTVGFSTRPVVRAGDDALWDRAEAMLENAAKAAGLDYDLQPGEGAFYGPKLEFILVDKRGRQWQCGTIQLDFVLPGRLDAVYIDADNNRQEPVMIHHAVLGSLERFIGMLLEDNEGRLPVWLAPEQVMVAGISDRHHAHAADIAAQLERHGLRVLLDDAHDTMARKALRWRDLKIPYLAVIGDAEMVAGRIHVRALGDKGKGAAIPLADFVAEVARSTRSGGQLA